MQRQSFDLAPWGRANVDGENKLGHTSFIIWNATDVKVGVLAILIWTDIAFDFVILKYFSNYVNDTAIFTNTYSPESRHKKILKHTFYLNIYFSLFSTNIDRCQFTGNEVIRSFLTNSIYLNIMGMQYCYTLIKLVRSIKIFFTLNRVKSAITLSWHYSIYKSTFPVNAANEVVRKLPKWLKIGDLGIESIPSFAKYFQAKLTYNTLSQ